MSDTMFFALEITGDSPEVYEVRYKRVVCSQCDTRPVARVGKTGVRFSKKAELNDFAYTDAGLIARKAVFESFTEHRLAGWRQGTLTARTVPYLERCDADYQELIVIGSTQGYAQSVGLRIREECNECGYKRYWWPLHGLPMPYSCWDNISDIFVIPELPGLYIVTEQVQKAIEKEGFTGVECVPLKDWHAPWWAQRDAERAGLADGLIDNSLDDTNDKNIWPPLKIP